MKDQIEDLLSKPGSEKSSVVFNWVKNVIKEAIDYLIVQKGWYINETEKEDIAAHTIEALYSPNKKGVYPKYTINAIHSYTLHPGENRKTQIWKACLSIVYMRYVNYKNTLQYQNQIPIVSNVDSDDYVELLVDGFKENYEFANDTNNKELMLKVKSDYKIFNELFLKEYVKIRDLKDQLSSNSHKMNSKQREKELDRINKLEEIFLDTIKQDERMKFYARRVKTDSNYSKDKVILPPAKQKQILDKNLEDSNEILKYVIETLQSKIATIPSIKTKFGNLSVKNVDIANLLKTEQTRLKPAEKELKQHLIAMIKTFYFIALKQHTFSKRKDGTTVSTYRKELRPESQGFIEDKDISNMLNRFPVAMRASLYNMYKHRIGKDWSELNDQEISEIANNVYDHLFTDRTSYISVLKGDSVNLGYLYEKNKRELLIVFSNEIKKIIKKENNWVHREDVNSPRFKKIK